MHLHVCFHVCSVLFCHVMYGCFVCILYAYICMYLCICIIVCLYMYVHLCIYIFVSMYVLIHTFICIKIFDFKLSESLQNELSRTFSSTKLSLASLILHCLCKSCYEYPRDKKWEFQ